MTIIVYRAGTLVADDMVTETRTGCFSGRTVKIAYRKKDKAILAGCGSLAAVNLFLKLAQQGREKLVKSEEDYSGIIARSDGVIEEWNDGICAEIRCDYFAIGCGETMALGALAVGADPITAARTVCAHYGWPADLHILNHSGHFAVIKREELPCHDSARFSVEDIAKRAKPTRTTRRPRPRRDRGKARQAPRRKHR